MLTQKQRAGHLALLEALRSVYNGQATFAVSANVSATTPNTM